MSALVDVSRFIEQTFRDNNLVNTVTFEKTAELDYNKENIYQLVNIDILDSQPVEEIIVFRYIITILQQRDIEPRMNNDKMFGSNMIDNLGECHASAVSFINGLRHANNDLNIDIVSQPVITFLRNFKGALDGCRFTLELSIPNPLNCI
jgi:hypothetical protein